MSLNKDTQVCISLSARPSNVGTRFHNFLYAELGLDYVYKAFATNDIEGAIRGVRALGIRGASISMPHKRAVLDLVDAVEPSAAQIGATNTIVNDNGFLTASNTDVEAVQALLLENHLNPKLRVVLRGSGGMASAVVEAFRRAGFASIDIWARNESAGRDLAERTYGTWSATEPDCTNAVIVNVTPLGMNGANHDQIAFSKANIDASAFVVDAVAFPWQTPLVQLATEAAKPMITGAQIVAGQAALQFVRYTGVTPTADQISRAAKHSQS
jgi:shikimate dehydrogenase